DGESVHRETAEGITAGGVGGDARLRLGPSVKSPYSALALASALWSAAALGAAIDAGYPSRPVRLVVPFAPGGTPDIQARVIAEPLRERLGTPIVVDNRVGANGIVGMEIVARAPADGYTLIIATVG